MSPAERAALREYWAGVKASDDAFMRGGPLSTHETCDLLASAHAAIPSLLDDCDRLTNERDEARELVRALWLRYESDDTFKVYDALQRWAADDARAAKKVGRG